MKDGAGNKWWLSGEHRAATCTNAVCTVLVNFVLIFFKNERWRR